MIIVHYTGQGTGVLSGQTEAISLHEDIDDFTFDYETIDEAKEANCPPGMKVDRIYNTEVDSDFSSLPMDRTLTYTF